MEAREWGPGLLLDAGQAPGQGASLTSSMSLLSAVKMQLIGAVVLGEPRRNQTASAAGIRSRFIILHKEDRRQPSLHRLPGGETVPLSRKTPTSGPEVQAAGLPALCCPAVSLASQAELSHLLLSLL